MTLQAFLERCFNATRIQVQFVVDDGSRRGNYVTLTNQLNNETFFVGVIDGTAGVVVEQEN